MQLLVSFWNTTPLAIESKITDTGPRTDSSTLPVCSHLSGSSQCPHPCLLKPELLLGKPDGMPTSSADMGFCCLHQIVQPALWCIGLGAHFPGHVAMRKVVSPALHFWTSLDALVARVWKACTMICVPVGPRFQERCRPIQMHIRVLNGAVQCVVTATPSRLMSRGI